MSKEPELLVQCDWDGCTETMEMAKVPPHTLRHIGDTVLKLRANVAEMAQKDGSATTPDFTPIADRIVTGVQQALSSFSPAHTTVKEMFAHAETCPGCSTMLNEARESFTKEFEAKVKASPKAAEPKPLPPQPAASHPKPSSGSVPLPPLVWDEEEESIDYFALGAYKLRAEPQENGKVVLAVEDEEMARQAIADGVVPESCVISVGADGKTQYICTPKAG